MLAARTCSVVPQWWLPDNARCRWDPAAFLACPAAAQARGEDCTSWQPLHDTLCIPYKAAGALPGKSSSSSSTPTRTVSASASSGPLHASRMQHELKLHARRRPELCCWHPGQRSQPLCALLAATPRHSEPVAIRARPRSMRLKRCECMALCAPALTPARLLAQGRPDAREARALHWRPGRRGAPSAAGARRRAPRGVRHNDGGRGGGRGDHAQVVRQQRRALRARRVRSGRRPSGRA